MIDRNNKTTTTTVQVASNTDRSGAVLLLGGGLILVNFLFGNSTPGLINFLATGAKAGVSSGAGTIPKVQWAPLLLSVFGVLLLLLLAKTGEIGGNFAVIFLVAAWIVWLLNKPSEVGRIFGQSSQAGPPQVNEPGGKKTA